MMGDGSGARFEVTADFDQVLMAQPLIVLLIYFSSLGFLDTLLGLFRRS